MPYGLIKDLPHGAGSREAKRKMTYHIRAKLRFIFVLHIVALLQNVVLLLEPPPISTPFLLQNVVLPLKPKEDDLPHYAGTQVTKTHQLKLRSTYGCERGDMIFFLHRTNNGNRRGRYCVYGRAMRL